MAFTPFAGAVVLVAVTLAVDTSTGLAAVTLVVFAACALALGLPAVQRVAPLTRAVPWSGGAGASRPTPAEIAMVVPFAAGGPVDTLARFLTERMRPLLGQPIIIENVGGAGGSIGGGSLERSLDHSVMVLSIDNPNCLQRFDLSTNVFGAFLCAREAVR